MKLNHRKILDGIFQACGVKEEDEKDFLCSRQTRQIAMGSGQEMVVEKANQKKSPTRSVSLSNTTGQFVSVGVLAIE